MTTKISRKEQRDLYLEHIARAAREYARAAPVSVPTDLQARAVDRIVGAYLAAADRNPDVWRATPGSVARAIGLSALTQLMPGGPLAQVDLIPRTVRKKDPATGQWIDSYLTLDWQIGFRGYIALAERMPGVRVRCLAVLDGDVWEHEEGLEQRIRHVPQPCRDEAAGWDEIVAVYTVIRLPGMPAEAVVVYRGDIEKRRAVSQAWRNYQRAVSQGWSKLPDCPWVDWPVEMALKTGIRYAAQRGRLPVDELLAFALQEDARLDVVDAARFERVRMPEVDVAPPAPQVAGPVEGELEIPDDPLGAALEGELDEVPIDAPEVPQPEPVAPPPEPAGPSVSVPPAEDQGGEGDQVEDPEADEREQLVAEIEAMRGDMTPGQWRIASSRAKVERFNPRTKNRDRLRRLAAACREVVADTDTDTDTDTDMGAQDHRQEDPGGVTDPAAEVATTASAAPTPTSPPEPEPDAASDLLAEEIEADELEAEIVEVEANLRKLRPGGIQRVNAARGASGCTRGLMSDGMTVDRMAGYLSALRRQVNEAAVELAGDAS